MSRYLLDTDTISLAQFGHVAILGHLAAHPASEVTVSVLSLQEQMDTELAVINSRQNDVQRSASALRDQLARVQYELATVQATVQSAEQERKERYAEKDAETKGLQQAREAVKALQASDEELRSRLRDLREEFKVTYKKNQESVGPR